MPIYILYCKDLKLQGTGHSENKNVVQLMLCESKVKADVQYTIIGIAARTLFQDSVSYITFLFFQNGLIRLRFSAQRI